jgi:quinol monooxygenase YgiN
MAIGVIFSAPGVTQAQYEQVVNEVAPGNKLPPGMLYHAGGPVQDGWRVVEVWESQEALDRHFREKLGAALQKANVTAQPEVFQVVNIMES